METKPEANPYLMILHLEDSPFDAEIIRVRLTSGGSAIRLDWASNAREFETLLRENNYDLVLADYELPGINAPAAFQQVSAARPGTPFICVSGAIDDTRLVELVKLGATDYVRKDRLDRLPLAIERAIEEAKQRQARQAAEAALRESERLYQSLVENLPQCVFRKDKEGRLTFANQRYCEIAGVPLEGLLGKTDGDLYPPELAAKYRADDLRVMSTGRLLDIIEELPLSDGTKHIVQVLKSPLLDASRNIVGVQGIFWDITERTRIEEDLRQQQLLTNTLLDSLPGIFYVYTYPELRLVQWNKNHESLLGFSPGEIKDRNLSEWHLPEVQATVRKTVDQVMSEGQGIIEANLLTKQGESIPYLLTGIRFEARGKLFLMGVGIDVTESKRAEAALRDSLREKEALLKEVHHRVKNNLQVISSLLRLQATQIEHPMAKRALQDMKHRVHSMALLHETLYRSENLDQVNMAEYFESMCQQLFRSLAQPSGVIELKLDLEKASLQVDQAIPCGLLVNELVSNALKHAFPDGRGGEVRVQLRQDTDNGLLRLRVSDDGVGLPANFQMRKIHSLGLQLVSDLASQLRGKLFIGPPPQAVFEVEFSPVTTAHRGED